MSNQVTFNEQTALSLVMAKGDAVTITSRTIAELFGKAHGNVRRAIRNLECSLEFKAFNFESTDFIDKNGDTQPEYHITRDGAMFLIMGFTGTEAAKYKEAVIYAFNRMEALIRQRQELDWKIQSYSRRADQSEQDGSFHGRGLAKRRKDKHLLALERRLLHSEAQLALFQIEREINEP